MPLSAVTHTCIYVTERERENYDLEGDNKLFIRLAIHA